MLKYFPKILTIFFLAIFIFQLSCLLFLALAPKTGNAADDIEFTPQIQVGDYKFDSGDKSTGNIARYIREIYKYAIGIVGILAAVVLMVGGVLWIIAGGNSTAVGEAKSWIGASLTGLVIALCSYLILATVNPALVDIKTTAIPYTGKKTPQNASADCEQDGNYCVINNQIGYCYDEVCNKCLIQGAKCSSNYECCGRDCYGVNGIDICNEEPQSVCEDQSDGELCVAQSGGKGYCKDKKCEPCKDTGFLCSSPLFANYECCDGDCESSQSGNICN